MSQKQLWRWDESHYNYTNRKRRGIFRRSEWESVYMYKGEKCVDGDIIFTSTHSNRPEVAAKCSGVLLFCVLHKKTFKALGTPILLPYP